MSCTQPPDGNAGDRSARAVSFDRGRRDVPQLSLTFDGGSDAGETMIILDVLEKHGVTATFFLTGKFIEHNPYVVRRIAAAGHEVGNHTWAHPHLTTWAATRRHQTLPGVNRAFLESELERTARMYEATTGRLMSPLWRAPFGEVNAELLGWAAMGGWSHVGWTRDVAGKRSLDSLGWVADRSSPNYLTSEQIADRILTFGVGDDGLRGGIVLMHLRSRQVDPESARLADLIVALRRDGYSLVTVSELSEGAHATAAAITAVLKR